MHPTYQDPSPTEEQEGISSWGPKTSKTLEKKRQCTHSIKHNEKCDGISRRSRKWSPFSQWPGSGTYLYHPPQNGPRTINNTHEKWQFHLKWNCKQYSATKIIKSHGHALLLDSRSNQTRPFPCILEIRHIKPGILFYQTLPAVPPQINVANIPPYRGQRKILKGCVSYSQLQQR